jgi:mannose-6-phosphate isomerase
LTASHALSPHGNKPVRLSTSFKEKVWGSTRLSPWYPDSSVKIGEVWFEADLPILIKFIFTSEKLSIQVHPDDEFAARHENSRGKTEMWHILRADPGAQIALGFREEITPERLHDAARSGEIMDLLNWVNVQPGETYFTPAGTVHAIGAGIALCEIQQNSDVTYRLYDYGRPRELHLEKAMRVCDTSVHPGTPVGLPVECLHFRTEMHLFESGLEHAPQQSEVLIFVEGTGRIGGEEYGLGEAWLVPALAEPIAIEPASPTRMLRTWVP